MTRDERLSRAIAKANALCELLTLLTDLDA